MYNFSRKPPYSIISVRRCNFSQIINRPKFSRNLAQRHNQDRLTTSNVNSEFLKRILNQNEVKYICNFCCVDDFKRRFKLFKEKSEKHTIFKTFKRGLHSNTSNSPFYQPRIRLAKWSIDEVYPLENHEKQLKQPQPTECKLTKKPQKETTSLKSLSKKKIPKIGLNNLFKQLKSLSGVPVPIETKKSVLLKPRIKKKPKLLKPPPKPLKHGSKTKSVIRTKTSKELKNDNPKCTSKWMDKPGLTMSSKPKQLEKLAEKKLKPSKIKSASKRKRNVDIDSIENDKIHKVSKSVSNKSLKAVEPNIEFSRTNKIDNYSVKWPYKQNMFPDNYSYQLAGSTKSWSITDKDIRTRYQVNENNSQNNESDEDSEDIRLKPVETAWVYKHLGRPFSKHKAYSLSNSLAKWSFKPDSLNSPVLSIEDGKEKTKSAEKDDAENKKDFYLQERSEPSISKRHKVVTTSSLRRIKNYPPSNELRGLRKTKSKPNWSTELVLPTNNFLSQQQYYDSSRYQEESNSIRSFKPLPSEFKDREKLKYTSDDETPETIRKSVKLRKTRAEKSTETDNSMQRKRTPSKITNIASFVLRKKREEQLITKQKKIQEQCRRMNRKKSRITVGDGHLTNLHLISRD